MSKAFCCDRCGRCFSPIREDIEFMTIPEYYIQNRASYSEHKVVARETDLHLCETCTWMFEKFMNDYSEEDSKNDQKQEPTVLDKCINHLRDILAESNWVIGEGLKGAINCDTQTSERTSKSNKDSSD